MTVVYYPDGSTLNFIYCLIKVQHSKHTRYRQSKGMKICIWTNTCTDVLCTVFNNLSQNCGK